MLSYPTLAEAEDAVATEVTALTAGTLNTPQSIQAAWVVVGYGLSLGFGHTGFCHTALLASPKAAPNINWIGLIQILLPVLQQILSGLGSGSTTTGT